MAELKADVVVLGAGMVGVGAALHLQQRGRDGSWSTGMSSPASRGWGRSRVCPT
jgi:glycine/D-amino acid oxidase-like deaminating enzyme